MRCILFLPLLLILPFRVFAQADADTLIVTENIRLESLEGLTVHLEDYHGKIVLLNFWATWCKSCLYEVPSISRAMKHFDEEDMVFILVSDESPKKIRKYQVKNGYEMEFLRLSESFLDSGIKYVPTTLILDREGGLVKTHVGFRDWSSAKERAFLESLIKK